MWLNPTAESKFTDQVHAVAVLPGSGIASGWLPGWMETGILIAAVGRRLVAFSAEQGRLLKHHLAATAQPVTCLSANPSIQGDCLLTILQDVAIMYSTLM